MKFNFTPVLARRVFICATVVHVLALLAAPTGLYELLFRDAYANSDIPGMDFYAIYQAGYNALHGVSLHDTSALAGQSGVPIVMAYRYLPVVAYALGAPLALFPPKAALALWWVLNEALLILCTRGAWRLANDSVRSPIAASLWLVFSPFYVELFIGQFNFAQASLIFALMVALNNGGARTAGAAWTASLLLKTNTLLFAPSFLRRGRWGILVAGMAFLVLPNLVYYLAYPADWTAFYERNLKPQELTYYSGNFGFRALMTLIPLPVLQKATAGFVIVALSLVMIRPAKDINAHISLWMATYFVFYSNVWEHHYVMALPALTWWFAVRQRTDVFVFWALLSVPTTFIFSGIPDSFVAKALLTGSKAIPACVFWFWSVWRYCREPEPT